MIWLIGGTSESVIVGQLITQTQQPVIVSVTTDNARHLYPYLADNQVFIGKLSPLAVTDFFQQHNITKVIDCSHPFATEISHLAINICQKLNIPYLRYERPIVTTSSNWVTTIPDLSCLLQADSPLRGKRVLLTIGAKYLYLFQHYHRQAHLFTRILPYARSLELATQAGFDCDRLIALRPPFSLEFEKALWQLWKIEVVVTKSGGKAGGEEIKYQVAEELKIPLLVVNRPKIDYPQATSELDQVKIFAQQ